MRRFYRLILTLMAAAPLTGWAQNDNGQTDRNLTTVDEIVREQQKLAVVHLKESHIKNIWKRRSFFDIIYGSKASLTPEKSFFTGVNALPKDYTADFSLGIKNGRSFFLHSKPIGQMAYIAIDYSWIDITVNKFKPVNAAGEVLDPKNPNGYAYDSDQTFILDTKKGKEEFHETPFNLDKLEVDYGMAIGPSLHLAPFVYIPNANALHHLRFNVYYHIGYNIGLLYLKKDSKLDASELVDKNADSPALDFGRGMTSAFGLKVSWKAIGVGFENHHADLKYQALDTKTYSKEKYDFKSNVNRLYLQFNF